MSFEHRLQRILPPLIGNTLAGRTALAAGAPAASGPPITIEPFIEHQLSADVRVLRRDLRLRALFECQPEGVAIFNLRDAVIDANPAAERILGMSRAELFDLPVRSPYFRMPGPDGTVLANCDTAILLALQTQQAIRARIMGIFNPARNETRWLMVDAIPYRRGEKTQSEVFAFFSSIAAPLAGGLVRAPPPLNAMRQRIASDALEQMSVLSGREREVLAAIANGHSNKLIAFNLGISARTVEAHRAHVLAKLHVRHSALAIRIAISAEFAQAPA